MSTEYERFLERKSQLGGEFGFAPLWMPDFLFDFQRSLVEWALRKGRAAIFADCGLGKTPMQLVWAENVVRKTGRPVLIITPLAVSIQTVGEGEKFGIQCSRSHDGKPAKRITITNYERLHYFNPADYGGCVCDESSILKSFDGSTKEAITVFMRKIPYRLLATATAAPNDYIELGTSSEALGEMGFTDMLTRFFRNDNNNVGLGRMYGESVKWRFKGHAEVPFWRWVTSWARACRKPSDLGFDDGPFILPPLVETKHEVKARELPPGMFLHVAAMTLPEQREERKRTIRERCEQVAAMVNNTGKPALVWCHLNDEGDLLERLIPDCVQVSGSDTDEKKEAGLLGFAKSDIRVLVSKPKIGAWGLNFQRCAHITYFPSHSYEQYYQSVRRCWRFGQKSPVTVDIVMTAGDAAVMANMQRKALAADKMFESLVREMNNATTIRKQEKYTKAMEVPSWL